MDFIFEFLFLDLGFYDLDLRLANMMFDTVPELYL